ncbi:olfactory receptor 5B12-like [Gastrophryne carolinensis]
MENQTELSLLYLSGLSNLPSLQLPLFVLFLLIYLLTLTWNLLIILLIATQPRLHTPMYFFLGNLASLDLCSSSVTIPRMLSGLLTRRQIIEKSSCITQVFFFLFFIVSEASILSIMSYDRYIAICRPLHYLQIMHQRMCIGSVFIGWLASFTHSMVHTLHAIKLTFCGSNTIESFFCDLPQLLQVSCSDVLIHFLLIFLVTGPLAGGLVIMTSLSYVFIVKTVLKMKVTDSRSKVFSTCSSHLIVVFMYYSAGSFNYFQPSSRHHGAGDKAMSVFYSTIIPFLNPLIYSLRNRDIKSALQDVFMGH